MKKITLISLCIVASLSSFAADFNVDGFYYNITSLTDLTAEIAKPDNGSYSGNITIPETVEWSSRTFQVTGINSNAFEGSSIGTLIIKDNIKTTNFSMNWGTIYAMRIEDSETPLIVEDHSYWEGKITEVYIGRDIEYTNDIGHGLFRIINGLTKATFGPIVTKIPRHLFWECTSLTTVEIPENVKFIGDYAFEETSIESIEALGVTRIGNGAFRGCSSLKIGRFSEALEEINGYAFANCTALNEIILPVGKHGGLHLIDSNAFEGCTALQSFVIPEGVVEIGSYAFQGCINLESVKIPSSVIDFSNVYRESDNQRGNVFKGCNSLRTITMGGMTPPESIENNFEFSVYLSATLNVPTGSLDAYKTAEYWKNFSNIQEDASITDNICTIKTKSKLSYFGPGNIELTANEIIDTYESFSWDYTFVRKGETLTIKVILQYLDYKLSKLFINGTNVIADVVDNTYVTTVTGNLIVDAEFEYDPYAAISEIGGNTPRISVSEDYIMVEGLKNNESIRVFNEAGIEVAVVLSNSNTKRIKVEHGHVYIIRMKDGTTKKVVVK